MTWKLVLTKRALKDIEIIKKSNLRNKVKKLMEILENDPFTEYPSYEKLCFNLEGAFSRRINLQHRIVYQILPRENTVKILRMWTHYDE